MDADRERIYVNINIQYEPKYFFHIASANYDLFQPIVERGGNYQLAVTDIQVDTRRIPLFLAEMSDYQDYQYLRPLATTMRQDKKDTKIKLNYWIRTSSGGEHSEKIYLEKDVIKTMQSTTTDVRAKQFYYLNNDTNLYIYTYQQFIDMVNVALNKAMPEKYKNMSGFAIRNERLVFLVQNEDLFNYLVKLDAYKFRIQFSHSLYQYLGVGFPVTYESNYWEYIFPSHLIYNNAYYALIQNEPALQSWNNCKAIVIYSDNLPVSSETFPTVEIKQDLTHYATNDYNIKHLYKSQVIHKKILYIHYIDYNKIKSLANGITAHNDNVENGIKIDVEKSLPINKIDVSVGWMDGYGNLFPLEIPYGSCCNVRMCFTRRVESNYFDYTRFSTVNGMQPLTFDLEVEPTQNPTYLEYTPSMDPMLKDFNTEVNLDMPPATPEYLPIQNINPIENVLNEEIIDENTLPAFNEPEQMETENEQQEQEEEIIDENANQEEIPEEEQEQEQEDDENKNGFFANIKNGINKIFNLQNSFRN